MQEALAKNKTKLNKFSVYIRKVTEKICQIHFKNLEYIQ